MNRRISASLAAVAATLSAGTALAQPTQDQPWSAEGRLEDSDTQAEGGNRYDEHRFRLEAGRRYRIAAESDEFDTLIRLFQSGENEPVAENDDAANGLNSRITYTPEETADYVLRVTSYLAEGRGAYSARAELLAPLPPPDTSGPDSDAQLRWNMWDGDLAATDPDRDGAYFDDYVLRVGAGETRLIRAESGDFDTMIWVLPVDSREGEPIAIDDDSGGDLNAMLAFRPEEPGDYLVRVTSYGGEQTGAYRLRISEPLTPPPPAPPPLEDEASHEHH